MLKYKNMYQGFKNIGIGYIQDEIQKEFSEEIVSFQWLDSPYKMLFHTKRDRYFAFYHNNRWYFYISTKINPTQDESNSYNC